jgi:hypothetical protein
LCVPTEQNTIWRYWALRQTSSTSNYVVCTKTLYWQPCFIHILEVIFEIIDFHSRDGTVVGFTTTFAINAYHHWSCEFKYGSGEVYLIQHYVIKFVSDLRQIGGFCPGTPVSSTNKTDCHAITEILLKVVLNTITLTI